MSSALSPIISTISQRSLAKNHPEKHRVVSARIEARPSSCRTTCVAWLRVQDLSELHQDAQLRPAARLRWLRDRLPSDRRVDSMRIELLRRKAPAQLNEETSHRDSMSEQLGA
jgi:hypothetical protein